MATPSSTVAQRIPWTDEPGGLLSMGFQVKVTPKVFTENSFDAAGGFNTLKSAEGVSTKQVLKYIKLCRADGEGNGTPLQYSCLENPMDGGTWQAAVHGVAKSWAQLSDFTFTFHFHALEKEMATHSSVLAWRIPGTEEPSGLPSMGSHRVRHN